MESSVQCYVGKYSGHGDRRDCLKMPFAQDTCLHQALICLLFETVSPHVAHLDQNWLCGLGLPLSARSFCVSFTDARFTGM